MRHLPEVDDLLECCYLTREREIRASARHEEKTSLERRHANSRHARRTAPRLQHTGGMGRRRNKQYGV